MVDQVVDKQGQAPLKTFFNEGLPPITPYSKHADEFIRKTIDSSNNQYFFGFSQEGLNARESGAFEGFALSSNQKEDEAKREEKKLTFNTIARITTISIVQFESIQNFAIEQRDFFAEQIEEIKEEIQKTQSAIEKNSDIVEREDNQVRAEGSALKRNAEDMSAYNEYVREIELGKLQIDLIAAQANGDEAKIKELQQKIVDNQAQAQANQEAIEKNNALASENSQRYTTAINVRGRFQSQLDELQKNLSGLKTNKAELEKSFNEYDNFIKKMDSPEIKSKLEAGQLTTEDLRKAGAPQAVLDKLKGQELSAQNVLSNTTQQLATLDTAVTSAITEETQLAALDLSGQFALSGVNQPQDVSKIFANEAGKPFDLAAAQAEQAIKKSSLNGLYNSSATPQLATAPVSTVLPNPTQTASLALKGLEPAAPTNV